MNEGGRGPRRHMNQWLRVEVGGCCDSEESLNDSIVAGREMLLDKVREAVGDEEDVVGVFKK